MDLCQQMLVQKSWKRERRLRRTGACVLLKGEVASGDIYALDEAGAFDVPVDFLTTIHSWNSGFQGSMCCS